MQIDRTIFAGKRICNEYDGCDYQVTAYPEGPALYVMKQEFLEDEKNDKDEWENPEEEM